MYECRVCDRIIGPEVLGCKQSGSSSCPFTVQHSQAQGSRIQGISFIILGSIFLVLILFFPIAPHILLTSSISASLYRILFLSVFLLLGLFVVFVGISLIFSRRLLIFNTKDRVSYQTNYFCSYQYRTKIIEDTKRIAIRVEPASDYTPMSIALLGDPTRVQKLLGSVKNSSRSDDPEAYDRAVNELTRITQRILEGAFLDLLGNGLLTLYAGTSYSSQVKTLDQTSSGIIHLLFPGTLRAERIEGRLERQIVHIVKNWQEQELCSEQPLAPTVALVIETITAGSNVPLWESIISKVLDELKASNSAELTSSSLFESVSENDPQNRSQELILRTQESNPGVYRIVMKEVEALFLSNAVSGFTNVFTLDSATLKYLRIGMVVAILLVFSLGRYLSGLSHASSFKEYVSTKTPPAFDSLKKSVNSFLPDDPLEALSDSAHEAFRKLEQWMEQPQDNVKQILTLARSSDVTIRRSAAKLLSTMQNNGKKIIPTLRKLLRDPDPIVRGYAILGLANFGGASNTAVPDLIFLLENDPLTAPRAAETLSAIGIADSRQVVNLLTNSLQHDNPLVQQLAKQALEKIATDDAISAIERALPGNRYP